MLKALKALWKRYTTWHPVNKLAYGKTEVKEELIQQEDGELKKQLVAKKEILGTPFHLVTTPQGVFILCGRVAVSKAFDTIEQAEKFLDTNTYDVILALILGVHELMERKKEWENKVPENN